MSENGTAIIAKMREIASEVPGFVYERHKNNFYCLYVKKDISALCGDCLIGRALVALGLIDAELVYNGGDYVDSLESLNALSFNVFAYRMHLELDANEVGWINYVQAKQDSGLPWDECIAAADKVLPSVFA